MSGYTYSSSLNGGSVFEFESGTNILLKGPDVPASDVMLEILSAVRPPTEGVVLINTRRSLAGCSEKRSAFPDETDLKVIDTVDSESVSGLTENYTHIPVERNGLTALGIAMVRSFDAFSTASRVRVGLDSLSSIMERYDRETVLHFLQIVCGRLSASGYLGLFVFDPSEYPAHVVATVESQFETVLRVNQDGTVTPRTSEF